MAVATVNAPTIDIGERNVLVKSYSENRGMLEALMEAGIVGAPVALHQMGWVEVPECPLLINV